MGYAGSQARGPSWNAVSLQEGSQKGEEPGTELSAHPQGQLCPQPDAWGPTEHQSTDQPGPQQASPYTARHPELHRDNFEAQSTQVPPALLQAAIIHQ